MQIFTPTDPDRRDKKKKEFVHTGLSKETVSQSPLQAAVPRSCARVVMMCSSRAPISLHVGSFLLCSGAPGHRVTAASHPSPALTCPRSDSSHKIQGLLLDKSRQHRKRTWGPFPAQDPPGIPGLRVFHPMDKRCDFLSGSHCWNFDSTSKIAYKQGLLPHRRRGAGNSWKCPEMEGNPLI